MTDSAPAGFTAEDVAAAVDAHDASAAAVRDALAAVQAVATDFPDLSVDDLVYEWRTRLHEDPLVDQTPDTYYLDVRESVWADFADRGDVTDLDAVRTAHRTRYARHLDLDAATGHGDADAERDAAGGAPAGAMVLARP